MTRMTTAFLTGIAAMAILIGCSEDSGAPRPSGEVVIYTSVDEIFARPVAEQFEQETGIRVRLVPDTEETKSTGLLNRLIAEKDRPVADVFWSGDPVRAAILKDKGVSAAYRPSTAAGLPARYSDPEHHWTGFSARARVLIYNTQTEGSVPQQLRAAAEKAGVPVVDVTETVAPGADSFEAWQVAQLTALAKALGVQQ